ncbi:MAG: hypothetical protein JNM61_03335 [Zoogloeaceae bacterium]|nr:hypothetical protein [Zoogloeaceae bacterium]
MNPWALVKDRGIKRVLIQLQDRLGPDAVMLSQRRADVPEAVTLCSPSVPGLGAFLFTYGQAEGRYGVHLAYPFPDPAIPASIEDLTATRLLDLLTLHFADIADPVLDPSRAPGERIS